MTALERQLEKIERALNEPKEYLGGQSRKEYTEAISGVSKTQREKKELTAEEAEKTLKTLEQRFQENTHLHEGCDWSRVKTALEANPEALWSVDQMEAQGHMPDVYNFDDNGFDIGTCSEEVPKGTRKCVYDTQAAALLKEKKPDFKFNGSAIEMAEAMGINLMSPEQYKKMLQSKNKGFFDWNSRSWLLTDEATRKTGKASLGTFHQHYNEVVVVPTDADNYSTRTGWRGSLRVSWA